MIRLSCNSESNKNSQVLKNKGEIHMKTKYAVKPSMGGGILRLTINLNGFSCAIKWIE